MNPTPSEGFDQRGFFHRQPQPNQGTIVINGGALEYLDPWRYFRMYLLYKPETHKSCWLPEGYDI